MATESANGGPQHETFGELLRAAAIRARVAFVLATAERVASVLVEERELYETAQNALSDGWKWEEGGTISARQLYDKHSERLVVGASRKASDYGAGAFGATISAMYYLMWHAFSFELREGQIDLGTIPEDIFEVAEDVIDDVIDHAVQTSSYDPDWVKALAHRICRDFPADDAQDLGPVVPRKYVFDG